MDIFKDFDNLSWIYKDLGECPESIFHYPDANQTYGCVHYTLSKSFHESCTEDL